MNRFRVHLILVLASPIVTAAIWVHASRPTPLRANQPGTGTESISRNRSPMPGHSVAGPATRPVHAPIPTTQTQPRTPQTGNLNPFFQRAQQYAESSNSGRDEYRTLPANFRPWWLDFLGKSMRPSSRIVPVNLGGLTDGAIRFSPHVQALLTVPQIVRTSIIEREAEFDWSTFVESRYDDLSDPVETVLVTGDSPQFRQNLFSTRAGMRLRNRSGGQVEVFQNLGFLDNNSRFYLAKPQGNARFEVSYSQPLLNGRGEVYNESRIVLARLNTDISSDQTSTQLQNHLLDVTTAYWQLYQARVLNLQKRRLLKSATELSQTLNARRDIDARKHQILRAESAVAQRYSEIVRTELAIRNAESRLRSLVNDPGLLNPGSTELIPVEDPSLVPFEPDMVHSIQTGLKNRPDIARAIREIRRTCVQLEMARHEVLPNLNLNLNAYTAGLEGEANIPGAWGNQFSVGEPGYSIGFLFEVPLGNRAARSRRSRREWEFHRARMQFRNTVENGISEIEVANREVTSSYQELVRLQQAMQATASETSYLHQRWQQMGGARLPTNALLEDLLDAQDRQADAEEQFVLAQTTYAVSQTRLKQVMGTLFRMKPNIRVVIDPAAESLPDRVPPAPSGGSRR